jgi:hypothetical protein
MLAPGVVVVVEGEEVVVGKVVGQDMVLVPVLVTVKLVGTGLMAEHMLREAVRVEVAEEDNMGALDPVMVQVLGMVKPVGLDPMVERMLREVA